MRQLRVPQLAHLQPYEAEERHETSISFAGYDGTRCYTVGQISPDGHFIFDKGGHGRQLMVYDEAQQTAEGLNRTLEHPNLRNCFPYQVVRVTLEEVPTTKNSEPEPK